MHGRTCYASFAPSEHTPAGYLTTHTTLTPNFFFTTLLLPRGRSGEDADAEEHGEDEIHRVEGHQQRRDLWPGTDVRLGKS